MKKVLCLLAVFVMLFTGCALAEETENKVDLGNMTLDEIRALYMDISSALYNQALVNGCRFVVGTYVIGEELPAGTYVFTFEWEDEEGWIRLRVYDENKEIVNDRSAFLTNGAEYAKITVKNGEKLVIDSAKNDKAKITIQLMVPFMMGI